MAVLDRLNQAKARLDEYYKAEKAILASQEYRIGTRQQKKALLADVYANIEQLENKIEMLESQLKGKGRNAVIGVVPRDI